MSEICWLNSARRAGLITALSCNIKMLSLHILTFTTRSQISISRYKASDRHEVQSDIFSKYSNLHNHILVSVSKYVWQYLSWNTWPWLCRNEAVQTVFNLNSDVRGRCNWNITCLVSQHRVSPGARPRTIEGPTLALSPALSLVSNLQMASGASTSQMLFSPWGKFKADLYIANNAKKGKIPSQTSTINQR